MKYRCPPSLLGCLIVAIAAHTITFAADLKSDVAARASQAEQLAGEAKEAKAAWTSSAGWQAASEVTATFTAKEAPLLADAEARMKQPDVLLAAEIGNLSLAQNSIKKIIETSPEAQRLVALSQRAAAVRENFAESGKRLGELGSIMVRSADNGVNIGKLEATQQMLKERIQTLSGTVASEKDAQIKAHNEAILGQASALLSGLDKQIADLREALERDQASATAETGGADMNAARTEVAGFVSAWNGASERLQYAVDAGSALVDARNVPSGLPKSVDDAVASAYANAPAGVSERVRKGFEAVMTHDWKLAKAWFGDALNHDPSNASLKHFLEFVDDAGGEGRGAVAAPASDSRPAHAPLQLPTDADLLLLFPGLAAIEARELDDYTIQKMVEAAENDPVLLRSAHRPIPNPSAGTANPYEIHN